MSAALRTPAAPPREPCAMCTTRPAEPGAPLCRTCEDRMDRRLMAPRDGDDHE